jgi:hypothetical protein
MRKYLRNLLFNDKMDLCKSEISQKSEQKRVKKNRSTYKVKTIISLVLLLPFRKLRNSIKSYYAPTTPTDEIISAKKSSSGERHRGKYEN